MRNKIYLLLLFAVSWITLSCGDDSVTKDPEINLSQTSYVIANESGNITIPFTSAMSWSAGSSVEWCTVSPSSGTEGNASISVYVSENTSYDERNGQINIISGTLNKSITITQKQKDAITLTSNKIEIDSEGGNATIEVQSNVDYTVDIEAAAKSWISPAGTRALNKSSVNLNISKNEDKEARSGKIIISHGNIKEEAVIYQSGSKPSLVLSQKEYTVSSSSETIKVELKSNTNYSYQISNSSWITESKTRAVSSYTHYFDIKENSTYDNREATITFYNRVDGISEVVTITQLQKNAITVSKDKYEFTYEASALDIDVKSNVDYAVEVSEDWISQAKTRGLVSIPLHFDISANETGEDRTAYIKFASEDAEQTITVFQKKRPVTTVSQTEFNLGSGKETISFDVESESKYTIKIEGSWIKQLTSPLSSNTKNFEIAANDTYEKRSGRIIVINSDTKDETIISVNQAQNDALVVSGSKTFNFSYEANKLEFEVKSNVD